MKSSSTQTISSIKWEQVWSLVALDTAIIISWIAYHKYQPSLLAQFGFSEHTFELAVVQGIILFLTPPIAGFVADSIRKKKGERLPVVNVGITFVSMVFMAVAFTVFANPSGILQMIFPLMIVLWLISMNIFHSPAISTVEMFVPPQKLPQVMAIFAVIADLSQSIEPSIVDVIDYFGAPITFAIGGILVFGTGYLFQKSTKNLIVNEEIGIEFAAFHAKKSNFVLVFILGSALGIGTTFFFNIMPDIANSSLSFIGEEGLKSNYFTSILIAFAALISYPISMVVEKQGVNKMAIISSLACLLIMPIIYYGTGSFMLIFFIAFPIIFATMSVSYLPLAFMRLDAANKVLGIGLFFSGIELANSFVEALQAMN